MQQVITFGILMLSIFYAHADEIITRDCSNYNTIVVGSITEWKSLGGFSDDGKPNEIEIRKRLIWARVTINRTIKSEVNAVEIKSIDILFFEPVLKKGETTGYTMTIKEFLNQPRIWSFNNYDTLILYPNFTFNTIDQENAYLNHLKTVK